jgi:glycosyltransferase involved in cell wall biosynthesis
MRPPRNTVHVLRADARGGLEVSTLHVVRYLAAQRLGRHAAIFLSPLGEGISGRLRELGVEVEALPYERARRLAFVRALAARMREMAPDLVLVHGAFGLHALIAAAARSAGVGRLWTFVVNRPPEGGLPRLAQQAMAHAARPFATGEIAVSDFVRRVLIDEYRLPAHRVHTAYRWRELDRIERTALAGRHTAGAGPVLGTIGRLDWMKDHATVIRALALLRRTLPGARLVIVGEGRDRAALAALARELGVAEHVALVGHQADVAEALGEMDLFVFATTQYEGLPNVLVEAMAARVPIVCTDVGPCREVLAGGTAGWLVPPRSPEALAAAAAALWRDPARRHALVETARRWVHARFTAEANGPALVRLLYPDAMPAVAPAPRTA